MPPVNITSFQNAKIKELVKLRDRSGRSKENLTVIDGLKEVSLALDAGIVVRALFICRDILKKEAAGIIRLLEKKNVDIYFVPKNIFEKISYGERKEGIVAICQPNIKTLKDLALDKNPLILVVENVEKPGNLGAIIRTADSAGISSVIVTDPKTDIYNPNTIRASTGLIFAVNIVAAKNEETYAFLKSKGIQICAATPEASTLYTKVDWKKPTAIVVGSEHAGLSDFWKNKCDHEIQIPLLGKADSLNVSVSGAVILYEAIRQRST